MRTEPWKGISPIEEQTLSPIKDQTLLRTEQKLGHWSLVRTCPYLGLNSRVNLNLKEPAAYSQNFIFFVNYDQDQ